MRTTTMIKRFVFLAVLAALLGLAGARAHATDEDLDPGLVFAPETQLTVYVDGEWSAELSDRYGFGDAATVAAPDVGGRTFSHWEAGGSTVSYANPLTLTMNAHTTLYAIYADEAPATRPIAGFTSVTRTEDGERISFQAIADPDGGAVEGAGIVYSATATGDGLKVGGAGVTDVPAERLDGSVAEMPDSVLDKNDCWMLQITPEDADTLYHARAYVTVGGTTAYGDERAVRLSALEGGISLVANLEGLDPETDLDAILAGLALSGGEMPLQSVVLPEGETYTYDGTEQKPEPVVKNASGKVLEEGTDYGLDYEDNTDAGTAKVTVTGKGSYTGEITATFTIDPAKLTSATGAAKTYNGKAQTTTWTVKAGDLEVPTSGYGVSGYKSNTNAGTASAIITGKGNFTGSLTGEFKINAAKITSATGAAKTYNGKAQTTTWTVNAGDLDVAAADYTVSDYMANTDAGTASATITGKGNFTGSLTGEFKINAAKITSATGAGRTYSGKAQTTTWTVKAGELSVPTSGYGVSGYKSNTNAGTASATVKGKGNFTGSVTGKFKINAAKITSATGAAKTYSGKAQTTSWTVKAGGLEVPTSGFTASGYKSNTNAGTASATVKGKGNFTGSVTGKFTIKAAKVTGVTTKASVGYTGKAVKPALTVKAGSLAVPASGYAATWSNNTKAGTATVSVAGKGNFTGSAKTTFKIVAPSAQYKVHRQTYGWETGWKADGNVSGTMGEGKRLEAIYLKLGKGFPVSGGIRYKTHIQGVGWESGWKKDGALSGTSGQAKRLEAIRIELTGAMRDAYDVYYRVHAQRLGWMGWARNGADAGTAGYSYRLEAIQVVLVPKGGKAPATTYKGATRMTKSAFVQK